MTESEKWGQHGAVLIMLLAMIVILGLAAGMAGQTWSSVMQREREAELLWRGQQYRQAIASYYQERQAFPTTLEHLLKDPFSAGVVRHLRKLYEDPLTGDPWEPIIDPQKRIIGVRSISTLEPFQKDGFPEGLDKFVGKKSYREWEFVFTPPKGEQTTPKATSITAPDGEKR